MIADKGIYRDGCVEYQLVDGGPICQMPMDYFGAEDGEEVQFCVLSQSDVTRIREIRSGLVQVLAFLGMRSLGNKDAAAAVEFLDTLAGDL